LWNPLPAPWVWIALVALAGAAAFYRSDDRAYWFHLAAGRSISQHGLPAREIWSLAARGEKPWLSEWLFDVGLYRLHAVAGDWGVSLWRVGWAALAMTLAVWILHLLGAATWGGMLLAVLVVAVARERFEPAPEQVFTVLVLLSVALFEWARRSAKDRTRWLVPAQALWANVHAAWVFGPILAWLYSAIEGLLEPGAAQHHRGAALEPQGPVPGASGAAPGPRPASPSPPHAAPRGQWLRWFFLAPILVAASAVVPRPIETLTGALRFLDRPSSDLLLGSLDELRRWSWDTDRWTPFTALLLAAAAANLLGGRRAWRSSPALCLFALATLALGILEARFRGLAAWVSLGPLAAALAPMGRWWRVAPSLLVGMAAAVAGGTWLARTPGFSPGTEPRLSSVPVRATALADSLGLEGPMLNSFRYGSYILWVRGDAHPPLVDERLRGRPGMLSLYARASIDPVALDSLVRVWDFAYAIVEPPPPGETRLSVQLGRQLDWGLLSYEDAGLLFVHRKRYRQLDPFAYRFLSPETPVMADLVQRSLVDPGLARLLAAELERARRESPYHAQADLWLGQLSLTHGDVRRAVALLDEAERLKPDLPGLALKQGQARRQAGDLAGARAAFRRALLEPEDAGDAQVELQSLP
jgi:hypothetical protein